MTQFVTLYCNPKTDQIFRDFIQSNSLAESKQTSGVILSFTRLLEHVSYLMRRENLTSNIEKDYEKHDKTKETYENFIRLFSINQTATSTMA